LESLQKQFSLYFKDVDFSKPECVRNPFSVNSVSRLMTCEQEQLTDSDSSWKDMFDAYKLPHFWLLVKNDYPALSDKAIKVLIPFMTT
jgi:hypothetical protein